MAPPTTEMDVTSSFTLNDNLANNNSTTQFYKKEMMDERNKMDLVWIHNYASVPIKHETQEVLSSQFIDDKLCENMFPWLNKFNKIMCSSVGNKNYQLLKHLILIYKQNILNSVNMYCENVLNTMKLKNHMTNTLTFFHLYWHEIKEDVDDCDWYLNEMSTLLGIYIDMELQTFKQNIDSSKLTAKLLSLLWIYLNNSEKHIFRVLLKLKFVTKKYSKICDPIFMKCFTKLEKNMESLIDIDYVRYLLVLKLWKRIKENMKERKEVNKIALTILGSCIPKMRDELSKIIPKPPIEHENKTIWLLQPNVFDLKTASNNFLAFEDAMSNCFRDSHLTKISNLHDYDT